MTTTGGLPSFEKGQKFRELRATELERLVEEVAASAKLTGVFPVLVKRSKLGTTIRLAERIINAIQRGITPLPQYIVREVPNIAGIMVKVERAVRHPDFSGAADAANLGRWISKSEFVGNNAEPIIEEFPVLPHWSAKAYVPAVVPASEPTVKATDILTLEYLDAGRDGLAGWHLRPNWRLFMLNIAENAPRGSCFPHVGP